jgi:hypothetical protein
MNLVRVYAVGIVATMVATYVIRVVSRRVAQRIALPASRAAESAVPMPQGAQFRIERRIRPAVIVLFLALILTILMAQSTSPNSVGWTTVGILELVCIMVLTLIGLIIDATLRCTACGKRMLLESMEFPPFPPPRKQTDAVRRGTFQCMYCGQRYIIPA